MWIFKLKCYFNDITIGALSHLIDCGGQINYYPRNTLFNELMFISYLMKALDHLINSSVNALVTN